MAIGISETATIATRTRSMLFLDDVEAAEVVAADRHTAGPEHAADRGVADELAEAHPADTGDQGDEGPDDRDETGQDQRPAAVALEEVVGLGHVLRVRGSCRSARTGV